MIIPSLSPDVNDFAALPIPYPDRRLLLCYWAFRDHIKYKTLMSLYQLMSNEVFRDLPGTFLWLKGRGDLRHEEHLSDAI